MSMRFLSNAAIALLGGFVAVASQAFAPAVTAWLAFSIAIAVLVISALAQLQEGRGIVYGLTMRTFEAPELARADGVRSAA